MRTDSISRMPTSAIGSPPRADIWPTERRLAEKPAPGAPMKMKANRGARPYLPNLAERTLILPSRTIHDEEEDDDCVLPVSLPFRPTRLMFSFSDEEEETDPTTVLFDPTTATTSGILSWHDEDEVVDMEEDNDLSPRLFHRFGNNTLSRYESIEIAEDESDAIFRSASLDAEEEGIQERFTNSPLQRCKDDVRI